MVWTFSSKAKFQHLYKPKLCLEIFTSLQLSDTDAVVKSLLMGLRMLGSCCPFHFHTCWSYSHFTPSPSWGIGWLLEQVIAVAARNEYDHWHRLASLLCMMYCPNRAILNLLLKTGTVERKRRVGNYCARTTGINSGNPGPIQPTHGRFSMPGKCVS